MLSAVWRQATDQAARVRGCSRSPRMAHEPTWPADAAGFILRGLVTCSKPSETSGQPRMDATRLSGARLRKLVLWATAHAAVSTTCPALPKSVPQHLVLLRSAENKGSGARRSSVKRSFAEKNGLGLRLRGSRERAIITEEPYSQLWPRSISTP